MENLNVENINHSYMKITYNQEKVVVLTIIGNGLLFSVLTSEFQV
jgi:hypothetical protein